MNGLKGENDNLRNQMNQYLKPELEGLKNALDQLQKENDRLGNQLADKEGDLKSL